MGRGARSPAEQVRVSSKSQRGLDTNGYARRQWQPRSGLPSEKLAALQNLRRDPRFRAAPPAAQNKLVDVFLLTDADLRIQMKLATMAEKIGSTRSSLGRVIALAVDVALIDRTPYLRPGRGGQGATIYQFDPALGVLQDLRTQGVSPQGVSSEGSPRSHARDQQGVPTAGTATRRPDGRDTSLSNSSQKNNNTSADDAADVDVDIEEFEELLSRFREYVGEPARSAFARAFAEQPVGFRRLVAASQGKNSPVGYALTLVRQGRHKAWPEPRPPCPECEIGGGRHAIDCSRAAKTFGEQAAPFDPNGVLRKVE